MIYTFRDSLFKKMNFFKFLDRLQDFHVDFIFLYILFIEYLKFIY